MPHKPAVEGGDLLLHSAVKIYLPVLQLISQKQNEHTDSHQAACGLFQCKMYHAVLLQSWFGLDRSSALQSKAGGGKANSQRTL